ncbi:MAG: glycosyltransferase family 87 protein [Ignavibacteria bacterium]
MSFFSKIFQKVFSARVQILWVAAIILSIYFICFAIQNAGQTSHGFASHYTASALLSKGENIVDFYDDEWFSSMVEEYVPGVYEIYLVNMPTTSLLLLPIANFNYKTAKTFWTIFNILLLTVVFGLIKYKLKLEAVWLPLALIILLAFQPLYANITFGQVYIFIFSLFMVAWFAYESGNELLLGISIGIVFILKSAGIFLLILLVVKKKWKSLLWFFAIVIFLFAVTIPILGIESWSAYLNKLLDYYSSPTLSVTAYQSVHSFFHHLFVFDQQWNPVPLINLPMLGKTMTISFTLIFLIVTIIAAIKSKKEDLVFGSFVIAGIILSPLSIDYHYMLILIPIFILFNRLIKNPSAALWILFVFSYLLIAASIPYISPKVTGGIWAVFAYPKLYGAVALWVLSLRASFINRPPVS